MGHFPVCGFVFGITFRVVNRKCIKPVAPRIKMYPALLPITIIQNLHTVGLNGINGIVRNGTQRKQYAFLGYDIFRSVFDAFGTIYIDDLSAFGKLYCIGQVQQIISDCAYASIVVRGHIPIAVVGYLFIFRTYVGRYIGVLKCVVPIFGIC